MADNAAETSELRKNLAIWSAVGAIVGAIAGGLGFSDAGINVQAGLLGLLAGALLFAAVTLLVTTTVRKAPAPLLQSLAGALGGWLFAGVIWEQKFERKSNAQLAGLVIGLLLTLVLLNRERLTKLIRGKPEAATAHNPEEKRFS